MMIMMMMTWLMTGLMLRPKLSTRSTEIWESPPGENKNDDTSRSRDYKDKSVNCSHHSVQMMAESLFTLLQNKFQTNRLSIYWFCLRTSDLTLRHDKILVPYDCHAMHLLRKWRTILAKYSSWKQSDCDNCSCLETFSTDPRPAMRSFARFQFGKCLEEERRAECRSSPDRPSSVRILLFSLSSSRSHQFLTQLSTQSSFIFDWSRFPLFSCMNKFLMRTSSLITWEFNCILDTVYPVYQVLWKINKLD